MVFPRYVAEQEDPELIAERELLAMSLENTEMSVATRRAKESSRAKEAAAVAGTISASLSRDSEEDNRSMDRASLSSISNSTASIDTLASTNNTTNKCAAVAGKAKESKADRKKRSRGVSGCSIKKDGGRFDMGLDDLEDDTYEDYDQDDYQLKPRGNNDLYGDLYGSQPLMMQESLEAKRVQKEEIRTEEWADALERTIKHNPKYISKYFELLIDEEESEPQVLRRLYKAINKIYQTRMSELFVENPMAEYQLMEVMRKLMAEGLIRECFFKNFLDYIVIQPHDYVDHAQELMTWTIMETMRFENQGRIEPYTAVPEGGRKLAREIIVENAVSEVAHYLADILPCFHAHFVYELFAQGLHSMSISKIYYAVQSVAQLYDNCIISQESILIGLRRLVREVPDMEKDLPAAASLAHLLFSYAGNMLPVHPEDKENLSPPKHMLYGSLTGPGHLEVREPPEEMGALSAENFMILEEE